MVINSISEVQISNFSSLKHVYIIKLCYLSTCSPSQKKQLRLRSAGVIKFFLFVIVNITSCRSNTNVYSSRRKSAENFRKFLSQCCGAGPFFGSRCFFAGSSSYKKYQPSTINKFFRQHPTFHTWKIIYFNFKYL